jgi:hypothetical protein
VKPAPREVIAKPGLPDSALVKDREPVVTSGVRLYPISIRTPLVILWRFAPMTADVCACAETGTVHSDISIVTRRIAGAAVMRFERHIFNRQDILHPSKISSPIRYL